MAEKVKKEKKKINFYKITTFILVGLILLILLGFGATSILTGAYNDGIVDGQANAVNILLTEVNEKGFVEIGVGNNKSVILVPNGLGEQKLVGEIFSSLTENGYVQINTDENNSVVLVPYQKTE